MRFSPEDRLECSVAGRIAPQEWSAQTEARRDATDYNRLPACICRYFRVLFIAMAQAAA